MLVISSVLLLVDRFQAVASVDMVNQSLAEIATDHSAIILSYDLEPFGEYGKYATDSAFPHADSSLPVSPSRCPHGQFEFMHAQRTMD